MYLVNAISFGAVVIALVMMRDLPKREPAAAGERGARDDVSLHAAVEGLRFVFRSPLIRSTMLLDFFATFFSSATTPLIIEKITTGTTRTSPTKPSASPLRSGGTSSDTCHSSAAFCIIDPVKDKNSPNQISRKFR